MGGLTKRRSDAVRSSLCLASLCLILPVGAATAADAPEAAVGSRQGGGGGLEDARAALQRALAYLQSECRRQANGLPAAPLQASGNGGSRTERWGSGHLGNNALVLLALRRCGRPETDTTVERLAGQLEHYVAEWGIPDTTWDTAWLAAAFANLEAPQFRKTRDRLLCRLLDSQLTEGAAEGMWGPLCINMRLFSELLAYERRLTAGQDERVRNAAAAAVAATLESLTNFYPNATQQALRLRKATRPLTLTDSAGGTVKAAGLPYAPYNQVFADMESTALVLIALSEAGRNRCLPKQTARPLSLEGPPVVPPARSQNVFRRAAEGIGARATKDGRWDACNVHEQAGPFARYEGAVFVPELKGDLASEATFGTTATALSALLKAARAAGPEADTLLRKHARLCKTARGELFEKLPGFLASVATDTDGQAYPAYRALLYAAGLGNRYGTAEIDEPEARAALLGALLRLQNSNGSWGARPQYRQGIAAEAVAETSSLEAWRTAFRKRTAAAGATNARELEIKLLDYMRAHATQTEENSLRVVATSLAMLCLVDLAVPTVAGFVPSAAQVSAPPHLRRAVAFMAKQSGRRLDYLRVRPEAFGTLSAGLPLLAVEGSDATLSAEVRAGLEEYVNAGGTLVATLVAGTKLPRIELALRKCTGKSRVRWVDGGEAFMTGFRGTRPRLRALYLADGRMAAVFLPPVSTTARSERGKITVSQATQTTYLLLKHIVDSAVSAAPRADSDESRGAKE